MNSISLNGRLISLEEPKIMGIINLTPDSFFAGSRYNDLSTILRIVQKMIQDGAHIIDIGAVSTRPNASVISVDSELKRLIPAVEAVMREFPDLNLSIDTYHSKVVSAVAEISDFIVNDISGYSIDDFLLDTVSRHKLPYILMHIKGTPQTMNAQTQYEDLIFEMLQYFGKKLSILREKGIHQIILDPGIGFAKTVSQNFKIIQQLSCFNIYEYPVLIGLSRKSFISKTLGITSEESLNGTTGLHMASLMKGSKILRVHDVKEAAQTLELYRNFVSNVND